MRFGPERAIGCVVDPACEVVAPGVIEHRLFKRFTIGEPDGSASDRIVALRDALISRRAVQSSLPPGAKPGRS
jgi:2-dehydropantoate 2-reductase